MTKFMDNNADLLNNIVSFLFVCLLFLFWKLDYIEECCTGHVTLFSSVVSFL